MQMNDFIRIKYTAKIKENGVEFDKNDDMPLVVGAEWIMKPLDNALLHMKISDKKTVEIEPEHGFGKRNEKLIKTVPLAEFKKHGQNPVPGMILNADNMAGKVLSVSSGRVKIDFNHPLAGKTLVFDLEIIKQMKKPDEKIISIIEWFMKPRTEPDKDLLQKVGVKIEGKEVNILLPNLITLNSVYKRKISDDIINFLGMEKIMFMEIFEKQKEVDKIKIDELNDQLPVQEVN